MKQRKTNIDFSILWKKIHSKVNEKEEEKFSKWTKETKSHEEYYNDAKSFFESDRIKNGDIIKEKEAWQKVQRKIAKRSGTSYSWLIPSISGIAAALIIGIFLFHHEEEQQLEFVSETIVSIPPGRKKATLIMNNGESIALEENKTFIAKVEGTEIQAEGSTIKYVSEKQKTKKIQYNTLEIPKGAEYFITLSDGSKVWLNSDSRLTYPVQFSESERVLELTGEAYFEVAKSKTRPFKVRSFDQTIEVLGTAFNVNTYNGSSSVATTLVEGKVNVSSNNCNISTILKPGEQANLLNNKIHVKQVDVNQYIAWKDGVFMFKNQTLEQMMTVLARWYDVSVLFENESKKQLRFTGELQRYENLENILELLEMTYEISFQKEDNSILIQ